MSLNILELLKSKEHNLHYLNRYYTFIVACQKSNVNIKNSYCEKHHILPKAKDMFPQFSNFSNFPENCVVLTFRQHVIAHYMLMKAYETRSQILSFLRTTQQKHVKNLNIKNINTKKIELAKIKLSEKMKGKFTRGYDKKGKPLVSEETRKKLSEQKKQFYSNPENRKKQSIACSGKKRKDTTKIKLAALRRERKPGDERAIKMKKTIEQKKKDGTWIKKVKKGLYVTPVGVFSFLLNSYRDWCLNADKQLSIHSAKKSILCNKSVVGKTPRELGFYFIEKTDLQFSQWYALLDQVHPPEPNHPLSLELNDFLLRENLLPQK